MLGELTNEIIQKIIFELKKDENQEQLKTYILDPTICYILDRLYPYIFITSSIFILLLLIAISILFLMIKSNYQK
jgi:hypothetical protein